MSKKLLISLVKGERKFGSLRYLKSRLKLYSIVTSPTKLVNISLRETSLSLPAKYSMRR